MTKSLSVWQRVWGESVRRPYVLPALFLLLGLSVPAVFRSPGVVLKNEDAFEYITGGQSIVRGAGYLGLSGRPQTLFPPGYPLAIALAATLSDPIKAAKTVSWLSSGLSVLLLFLIARDWFGVPVAAASALLFSFLPLRVWLAQAALSEPLYVMLLLLAILVAIRTRTSRLLPAIGLGLILGWAYITRPEAVILIGVLGFSLLVRFIRSRKEGKYLAAYALGLMAVILPYVLWLSIHTGHFAVTGKAHGEVGRGIARLQGKPDVLRRILSKDGSTILIANASPGFREFIAHVAMNLGQLKNLIMVNTGVQPIAGALLLLGLLEVCKKVLQGGGWQFGLLQLFFVLHLILYSPFWVEQRLMYASSPALCFWMVMGAGALFSWIRWGWEGLAGSRVFALATVMILMVSIVGSFAWKLQTTTITDDKTGASQEMALTLKQSSAQSDRGIIGEYPGIAFFAGIHHEWMPNCDLDQLRRFASINNAPLVALSERDGLTPATAKLLSGNYGPDEAQLLAKVHYGNQDFQMFRLSPVAERR